MIDIKPLELHEFISYASLTLILQSIVFGALGILMIFFPKLLDIWLVANFVWMGTSTMLLAVQTHQLSKAKLKPKYRSIQKVAPDMPSYEPNSLASIKI